MSLSCLFVNHDHCRICDRTVYQRGDDLALIKLCGTVPVK